MSTTSESSGPPLRALAMVLISLAILFAGLGLASLGGSDSESPAPEPTTEPAAAPATTSATSAPLAATSARTTAPGAAPSATTTVSATTSAGAAAPVRVLNNSNVSGLAAQTAGLLEDEGFTVAETGNYSDGVIETTSVYYGTGPGERQTAEAVAEALGVTAQPRFAGIQDSSPGVIVIVTSP
ncbi:glycoprotein [Rhodococcus sp. WB1]|uniref:LytR C-terminal domain-containing protein n=1 Tax=Rhodococcus TaxID=1827 RepID=UPI00081A3727|nr:MULTISPECIES: LytR C-terminal domain-containing protein [Rhodococcus]ANZ24063.1 glycoprotein [Rhodococcus sp. WB1]UGQ42625.1 LytR C-terminal domain-containing protein [Rhodococcus aetherivorans]USC14140.1 LytR C-terminal domain-containing protein [Rhodococcus sp. 11-3]WKW97446.1 LytR C-terminal domain-containing protein [Rhodococcus aetherivorans]